MTTAECLRALAVPDVSLERLAFFELEGLLLDAIGHLDAGDVGSARMVLVSWLHEIQRSAGGD